MEKYLSRISVTLLFLAVVVAFYLLSIFSAIVIPLIFAFLAASMYQPLTIFLRNKKIPFYLIIPSISIITLGILFLMYLIISSTVVEISTQSDDFAKTLTHRIDWLASGLERFINERFHTTISVNKELSQLLSKDFVTNAAKGIVASFTSFTNGFFWFSVYFVVFLFSLPNYRRYLRYVAGRDKLEIVTSTYITIQKFIYTYANIKLFINLVVGILVYVVCVVFEIKFAFLWGFVAFLLHFIPFIGAIISVLFPSLMALIQYDDIFVPGTVLILLTVIQMGMGNIVEPVMMGNKLRLNTITAIFGLVFWGFLWA